KYANTRNRATLNYYKTNYTAALRYFQQAANEAERLGLSPQTIYEAYSNILTGTKIIYHLLF
ncbi:MAG: hypothetical protein MUE30_18490, partial [Spirosomaceae bacterium]|nr:hypothetical protein [Spirosomataceae bacterium]